MQTKNQADENFTKLAALFPNAVTETIDINGNLVRAIDKDILMQEISTCVVEGRDERYQFTWPDKRKAILAANAPSTNTLRPCIKESYGDFNTTENLYIEGDNLEVLKLLQENYLDAVKLIYIDPPYNTGKEFVYSDKFSQTTSEYMLRSGQYDEDGNQLSPNMESNGRFHTDWLNMMYSRLKIARNLLTKDGVIFISIDQNEVENLKKICNELFGSTNFVGEIIWQSATDNNPRQISTEHEYILCFAKDVNFLTPWFIESDKAQKINEQYKLIKHKTTDIAEQQKQLRQWIKANEIDLKGVSHYNNVDERGVYSNSTNSSNTKPGGYTFYQVDASLLSISSFIIGLLTFLVIGFLAWKYGRTWCNTICPVGTLLGFLSRFSLFKVRIDTEKCNHCGLCATKCKASCINSPEQIIDYSRCVDCFDCLGECRQNALSYTTPLKTEKQVTDASKRRFLLAGLTTAAATPKVMAQAQNVAAAVAGMKSDKRQTPITPPGSISLEYFQAHCTSCHLCISKCPSHVLKPAFMEYGLGGMMQPTVFFEKGFCNFDCTVCGDVCPNGAILPLTKEQKHLTQMGKVVFIEENCIVYRDGTSCGACSEHCPTQALSMIPFKDGLTIPHIDTEICVGCGGCEYVCPARPFRAVYIEGNAVQQEAKPFIDNHQEEIQVDDFGF